MNGNRENLLIRITNGDSMNDKMLTTLVKKSYQSLVEIVSDQNDLSCALIGASILDASLEKLLNQVFKPSSTSKNLLESDSGALGNLKAKADLAYVLRLIGKDSHNNLKIVLEIRNIFAHNQAIRKFSDNQIQEQCDKFNLRQLMKMSKEVGKSKEFERILKNRKKNGRKIFLLAVMSLMETINIKMTES